MFGELHRHRQRRDQPFDQQYGGGLYWRGDSNLHGRHVGRSKRHVCSR
jgi:hypothetical protein